MSERKLLNLKTIRSFSKLHLPFMYRMVSIQYSRHEVLVKLPEERACIYTEAEWLLGNTFHPHTGIRAAKPIIKNNIFAVKQLEGKRRAIAYDL